MFFETSQSLSNAKCSGPNLASARCASPYSFRKKKTMSARTLTARAVSPHLRISSGRRADRDRPVIGRPRSTVEAALVTSALGDRAPVAGQGLDCVLGLRVDVGRQRGVGQLLDRVLAGA